MEEARQEEEEARQERHEENQRQIQRQEQEAAAGSGLIPEPATPASAPIISDPSNAENTGRAQSEIHTVQYFAPDPDCPHDDGWVLAPGMQLCEGCKEIMSDFIMMCEVCELSYCVRCLDDLRR